jgi:hypothetical protein
METIRYLKGTPDLPLEFAPEERQTENGPVTDAGEIPILAYTDADWGGDLDDRKSTTGYVVFVYGCAVSWQSKKQTTVALSTAEAEYMAISSVLQEIIWLHHLLEELGLRRRCPHEDEVGVMESFECSPPAVIFTDNRAAKSLCESEGSLHSRTKHIDLRHNWIKDAVRRREVRIEWCQSSEQVADIFTKPLDKKTFKQLRERLLRTSQRTRAEGADRE